MMEIDDHFTENHWLQLKTFCKVESFENNCKGLLEDSENGGFRKGYHVILHESVFQKRKSQIRSKPIIVRFITKQIIISNELS